MKIASWNVNGLRAVMKKKSLEEYLANRQPDILCLQEIKIKEEQIDFSIDDYTLVINSADRAGYSGTAFLIRDELVKDLQIDLDEKIERNIPIAIADKNDLGADVFGQPNDEGRVLTLELPSFFLVTVYTPNSKGDLSRLSLRDQKWDPAFLEYVNTLREKKPVVFCGDLNVAATEIDLANPKANVGKHGFTLEERKGFANYIKNGFVDSFRYIHGDVTNKYTWWTHWANARARNVGWRIDYFMVDNRLLDNLRDATIIDDQMGSDHCPIELEIMK